jgi:hypothetical protein
MEGISAVYGEVVGAVRGWGHTVDVWVSKNVTKDQQTYFLFGLILCMVLHLVYTKRKVVREAKEQEAEAAKKKK